MKKLIITQFIDQCLTLIIDAALKNPKAGGVNIHHAVNSLLQAIETHEEEKQES